MSLGAAMVQRASRAPTHTGLINGLPALLLLLRRRSSFLATPWQRWDRICLHSAKVVSSRKWSVAVSTVSLAETAAAEPWVYVSFCGQYVIGQLENLNSSMLAVNERGIRKEPGRRWIEVDNKIHRFGVGDKSHPEAKDVYAELNKLIERIKAGGHNRDIQLVLENIDEEDKGVYLCSHSEKLLLLMDCCAHLVENQFVYTSTCGYA